MNMFNSTSEIIQNTDKNNSFAFVLLGNYGIRKTAPEDVIKENSMNDSESDLNQQTDESFKTLNSIRIKSNEISIGLSA